MLVVPIYRSLSYLLSKPFTVVDALHNLVLSDYPIWNSELMNHNCTKAEKVDTPSLMISSEMRLRFAIKNLSPSRWGRTPRYLWTQPALITISLMRCCKLIRDSYRIYLRLLHRDDGSV